MAGCAWLRPNRCIVDAAPQQSRRLAETVRPYLPCMDPVIEHDTDGGRFTATIEGRQAVLVYRRVDERTVDFASTYVPDALRGHQVGSRLVRHALVWARAEGLRVVPSCWFVKVIAGRRPEDAALLVG